MTSLEYIKIKYGFSKGAPSPIEIPNVGRVHLAELFSELDFKVGAEIGVDAGVYSEQICKANPKVTLFCIDCWQKVPSRWWVTGYRAEQNYKEAQKRLSPYTTRFIKEFSKKALEFFARESLDFVYIDADHRYDSVMEDIFGWSEKVRPGGIIAGHDFIKRKGKSEHRVVDAVMDFTRDNKISPWFVLGSKAKVEGQIRDDCRSWMWVKP